VVVQAVERSDAAASAEAAPAATPSAAPLSQDGKGQNAAPESKAGKAPQS
jgi:hypothetical protein